MSQLPATVAVLDVGKTNIKLWAACADGTLVEQHATDNRVLPGPPWRHHDLAGLSDWLGSSLADLCTRHPIRTLVPVGHGSGGVLVGPDPDAAGAGAALPMIDYEESCPPEVDAEYTRLCGTFEDRGSPVMMAMTHAARQLLLMQRAAPEAVAGAAHYLNVAQFWGWWLSGVAASEYSAMGAQSHFWNVPQHRWAPIVDAMGWHRLLPPFRHAGAALGPIRPALARRFGLPEGITVLTGAHDSSSNFHRYRAAGLTDFTVVSTGTWVVALSAEVDLARLDERRSVTLNAGMDGKPVGGALAMGGREFSLVAGPGWQGDGTSLAALIRLVDRGMMTRPSFSENEGQFPGSAGRGAFLGPAPESQADRTALAVMHAALITVTCADVLGGGTRLILDGTFIKEPLYAPLVAALRPDRPTLVSDEPQGVVVGAVSLAHPPAQGASPLALTPVTPIDIPGLAAYRSDWQRSAMAPDPQGEFSQ